MEHDLTSSCSSTAATAKPRCARDPASLLQHNPARGILKPQRRWNPSQSWETWEAVANSATSESSASEDEPGVTQRFGEWRTGRDRWHRPDGSTINRQRERLQQVDHPALSTIEEDNDLFSVQGTGMVDGAAVVQVRDYTGDTFLVKSNTALPPALPEPPSNTSTTAGVDCSASSSSSSSTGFWRHGEFQARPRTAAEQRAHEGGRGSQRMARKQKRADDWRAGVWKPAWLQRYISDRQAREMQGRTEEPSVWDGWKMDPATGWWSNSASTTPSSAPSSTTGGAFGNPSSSPITWTFDDDPLAQTSAVEANEGGWSGAWHEWGDDVALSSTTSSSTSAALQEDIPPNFGFFPEVHEVDEAHTWMMSLTNAERAMLQEGGVPARELDRVEQLLTSIDDHDSADRGPEARWALGRMVQRIDEGLDTVEKILQVLLRRLRPRGVWPVVRTPVNQVDQLRLFNWVRNFGDLFPRVLERHLGVPLQPSETGEARAETPLPLQPQASSSSGSTQTRPSEAPVRAAPDIAQVATAVDQAEPLPVRNVDASSSSSWSTNEAPRSRSRSRSRASSGSSILHYDSDNWGLPTCLFEAPCTVGGPADTTGRSARTPALETNLTEPPTSSLDRALRGELLGIWREPPSGTTSSTSTTTTGGDVDELYLLQWPPGPTTLTTTTWPVPVDPMWTLCASSSWVSSSSPCSWSTPSSGTCSWSTTSTSTTSTSSTLVSAEDLLRDAVGREAVMANTADLVDVAHRLLSRSRALVQHQRMLLMALEELLVWMPVPPSAAIMNGPTMDAHVWQAVVRGAAGQGGDVAQNVVEHPAVLLQPGVPSSWDAIAQALPNTPPERILNYRRRLWRDYARRLCPLSVRTPGEVGDVHDDDLYLLQVNESEPVPVPDWAAPVPTVPPRSAVAGRRRQRQPRPEPCFREARVSGGLSGPSTQSLPGSSSTERLSAVPSTSEVPTTMSPESAVHGVSDSAGSSRERSRSRDV